MQFFTELIRLTSRLLAAVVWKGYGAIMTFLLL